MSRVQSAVVKDCLPMKIRFEADDLHTLDSIH